MINIEIEVNKDMIEDALVDMIESDFALLVVSVVERMGDRDLIKELIGRLGESYEYISKTFYDD